MKPIKLALITTGLAFSLALAGAASAAGTPAQTGLQNLTKDVASCLVHFGPDTTQTWLLVRQKQPEMPTAPQTAAGGNKES